MHEIFFLWKLSTTFTASMNCMRTWLLAIIMGIALFSCRSRGASDINNGLPVTDIKELKGIVGAWHATEDTYAMLVKKNYVRDSIYIVLRDDSVFKAYHLPDCMDAAGNGGLLLDAVGTWKLHLNGNDWKLSMAFEKGRLFRHKTFTDFDILVKDSVLTLFRYIGDPEEAEALQFRKSRQ